MPLPAGRLTSRVTLERDDLVRVKGVETKVPHVYGRGWAKIEALRGREYWAAQQVNSEVEWEITMNYRTDVKAEHRVNCGPRQFEVIVIRPDLQRKETLLLWCRSLND